MKNEVQFVVKQSTKRDSKSYNDAHRTFEGKLARRAKSAFKQRKHRLQYEEQFAY